LRQFNGNLEDVQVYINKITARSPIREKAFFTIMRQSGLKPNQIKKLRLKNVDTSLGVPFKIELSETDLVPAFVGEEAARYLNQYLATRKDNLKPESLLFASHKNSNQEINTKDVSRTFRIAAVEVMKEKTERLQLFSLVKFYRTKAKHYIKELKDHPFDADEKYRELYEIHALPFLQIESTIMVQAKTSRKWFSNKIERQNNQIRGLQRTIAINNEYMASILSLLYDNKGDWNTGENVKLGDKFIKLWQKAVDVQIVNPLEFLNGRRAYIPPVDILEELTKTLQKILKPYGRIGKNTE
jgi:hypothetical protein